MSLTPKEIFSYLATFALKTDKLLTSKIPDYSFTINQHTKNCQDSSFLQSKILKFYDVIGNEIEIDLTIDKHKLENTVNYINFQLSTEFLTQLKAQLKKQLEYFFNFLQFFDFSNYNNLPIRIKVKFSDSSYETIYLNSFLDARQKYFLPSLYELQVGYDMVLSNFLSFFLKDISGSQNFIKNFFEVLGEFLKQTKDLTNFTLALPSSKFDIFFNTLTHDKNFYDTIKSLALSNKKTKMRLGIINHKDLYHKFSSEQSAYCLFYPKFISDDKYEIKEIQFNIEKLFGKEFLHYPSSYFQEFPEELYFLRQMFSKIPLSSTLVIKFAPINNDGQTKQGADDLLQKIAMFLILFREVLITKFRSSNSQGQSIVFDLQEENNSLQLIFTKKNLSEENIEKITGRSYQLIKEDNFLIFYHKKLENFVKNLLPVCAKLKEIPSTLNQKDTLNSSFIKTTLEDFEDYLFERLLL